MVDHFVKDTGIALASHVARMQRSEIRGMGKLVPRKRTRDFAAPQRE